MKNQNMDAEEEGMLEAEDGEVEDDNFSQDPIGRAGSANHSPQLSKVAVNQDGSDRKNSNLDTSPRHDSGDDNDMCDPCDRETNSHSAHVDTDKEERKRRKKEKKREKKMKREKKRRRSESEEADGDDDGETLIKKSKPVPSLPANPRIAPQHHTSNLMWYNADELEEGEELSEAEENKASTGAQDDDSQLTTSDFIRNQRTLADKESTKGSGSSQFNQSPNKSSSGRFSHGSSEEKHRSSERDNRDIRDNKSGKPPPRKTRWSPAYDSASSRDFRERDQESSKDSNQSRSPSRRDREASDSDDQRKRSKHSKHKSSDEDSEVLGGRSSDDVSRDRENDDKNRRRRRWENDEEPRNEDEDSRRTRRGKGDKENSDQDGSRGGPKGGKYWKKGFGSSWHHEDHDNPVGSPPNLSSKDQDDYAAKLSEYRTSQENDKMMSKKRKKRGGDFDNGNGFGGDWKPCFFYRNGFCKLGPDCDFSHDCEQKVCKKEDVCRPYMHGNCKWGDNCNMLHGQFPCKYHARGLVCYKGDYCLFSHDKATPYTLSLLEKWLNSNPRHQNNQNNFNSGPHYSAAPPQTNMNNNQSYDNHNQSNSRNDQSSRSRLPSKWSDHPPPDKANNRDRARDYFEPEDDDGGEDPKPHQSERGFEDSNDREGNKYQTGPGSQSMNRSPSNQFGGSSNQQSGPPVGMGPGNFGNNQRMTTPGMQRFSLPGMPAVSQAPAGQMPPSMSYNNSPRGPVSNPMGSGGPPGSAGPPGMMNAPHPNANQVGVPNNNQFVSGAPYNGPPGPNMSMPPRGLMNNPQNPYYNNSNTPPNQGFNVRGGNYMDANVPPGPPSSMPYNPNQPMHGPPPPGAQMGHPPPRMMMGNHPPQPNPGMPYNPNLQTPPGPPGFMNNISPHPQPGFPPNGPLMGHPQRLPMMPGVPLGPSGNPQMGGILPIPRPPGSPYGAYPPVDNRAENTEEDSIDKLVKVKSEVVEDEEKPIKVEEITKKPEAQKEGPKLRIETFPSESQSNRAASNTPTTPTPVLHKGTQLIPIELLDTSIKDPRVSKGFVSSSIYYDISSRPVKISVQTCATSQDGAQISCTELIPWRLPAKVDFAKMFMNSLSIDTMSPSSTTVSESPTKSTPSRPTDPRKRSSANSSKSQQPSSPKTTQGSPLGDKKMPFFATTESPKAASPLASPIPNRSVSSDSENNPPSPVTPGPELFSRLDSYTPPEVAKVDPSGDCSAVKMEIETSSNVVDVPSPEKASPSGLTPFVLPSESLSPNKAEFDSHNDSHKYLGGSYANKPKASLSIAEYMKRRNAGRSSGASESLLEQEKCDNLLAASKSSESLLSEIGGMDSDERAAPKEVEMSSNPYDFGSDSMAAIPSFKDLFKDPTASPFG